MDKNSGYDNAACCAKDGDGAQKPSMEMERVVDCRPPAVAKCCNVSSNGNNRSNLSDKKFPDAAGTPNACLPKCPAVKASPWDPIKTRIALFLMAAIAIWLLIGVIAQNF